MTDTFWVNLIGRGYPAPRPKFRWCTERLKIKPSNTFIREMVQAHGEAILVLGTRKAEQSGRSHRMTALEERRVRDLLSPNDSLPNCLVYSPVEDWSNDDVWIFLMQANNPWGYSNKELLTMYQGASADGECPLVVDASTPSCGDSRFGCWTCTLVDKDKSMSAMIQNDEEKEWMLPLLELRNELDVADDRHLRDFRRMNGSVQLFHDRPIPGPYTQAVARALAAAAARGPDLDPRQRSRLRPAARTRSRWPSSRRSAASGWSRSTSSRTTCPASMSRDGGAVSRPAARRAPAARPGDGRRPPGRRR